MSAHEVITLVVLAGLAGSILTERVAPTSAMVAAVGTLFLSGVIDAPAALSGFSNTAPFTVAALYVIAGAAESTGALGSAMNSMMGSGTRGIRASLARLVYPTAAMSAFVPNTPLVALLAPRVTSAARRRGESPSRYLMPLSFATVFGGTITLLGTSTNLVVAGLWADAGFEPLGVFSMTRAGLPIAVIGLGVMAITTPFLLSDRRTPGDEIGVSKEFTMEFLVVEGGACDGVSVTEAGLRHLEGVFLVALVRREHSVAPVGPDEVLLGGDRLIFAGQVARIVDVDDVPGLDIADRHHFGTHRDGQRFYEAVVSPASMLSGSSLKEAGFRSRFGGAVVAVHRAGERLAGKLGVLRLRPGDVLLVVADEGFAERAGAGSDFSVIAPFDDAAPSGRRGAWSVRAAVAAVVVVSGMGWVGLTKASVAAALALIALRILTPSEARRSINLDVIAMIALSFGLGAAASQSGLAGRAASGLVSIGTSAGDVGVLVAMLVATALVTEVVSNNAAVALMFPVALDVASRTGMRPLPLVVAVLMMASCSFLTPIGYQTNLMVFGMGGYRFSDFARVGAPLTLATIVAATVVIPLGFPLR